MKKKEDFFTRKWQMSARIKGEYNTIAASVDKCVFCDLKEKYIIAENSGLVLTANLFPYTTGHLLVIPRRHKESYFDLTQKELIACYHLVKKGFKLLQDVLDIDGIWLLLREGKQVGKTVKHLHWQIIPYVEGLADWHYQKIEVEPEALAKILRKRK